VRAQTVMSSRLTAHTHIRHEAICDMLSLPKPACRTELRNSTAGTLQHAERYFG